jgi:drug/metabolite transporter (DMT)-like permease
VDATCKSFTDELHAVQLVWGYFIGILVTLSLYFIVRLESWLGLIRTNRPILQWMRGAYLAGSIMCLFVGLTFLPLAEAIAIGFMAPLFITGLSMPLLREKVSVHRWIAVIAGLVGVCIIVRPGSGLWQWAAAMPLIGAVCFALYQITTRMLTATEKTHSILFYTALTGAVWSTAVVVFFWRTPQLTHWGVFFGTGVLGAAAHLCLVNAFSLAEASLIAPFNYTKLLWVSILGYLLFDDMPTVNTLLGSIVIIVAGLYVLYREFHAPKSLAE